MPSPIAADRRALARLLDERMQRTYSKLVEGRPLELEGSLVKTYLLEAHLPEEASTKQVEALLKTVLQDSGMDSEAQGRARKTDEELFFQVDIPFRDRSITLFVDASNTRFWVVHTVSNSVAVDRAIGRLTQSAQLDHAWLFAQLLEETSARGSFRGLGLDYDRRVLADIDLEAADAPVGFLKMQLWHSKAADVLGVLRDKFPSATALAKIKVKYWNEEQPELFCLDDLKFNGKVTARGTSFDTHVALVSDVYATYAGLVRSIEKDQRLSWTTSNGRLSLDGAPINFRLSRPIANLERFCELLFSATPPFRLWGVPEHVNKTYCTVNALDLHVGSTVDFEITEDFIRMYLSADSCGNSVLRFFTNLQHHYDAKVEALDADERPVFTV